MCLERVCSYFVVYNLARSFVLLCVIRSVALFQLLHPFTLCLCKSVLSPQFQYLIPIERVLGKYRLVGEHPALNGPMGHDTVLVFIASRTLHTRHMTLERGFFESVV